MNAATGMPTAENSSRNTLVAEVENRLQFNVFVSIFFCTLLYAFFRSIGKTDVEANTAMRNWSAVTAFFLASYVLFEAGRSIVSERWLKCTSISLLVGVGLFVLPMSMIAAIEAKWATIEILLGVLSFLGIPIIALLLLILIVIAVGLGIYDWGRERKAVEQAA